MEMWLHLCRLEEVPQLGARVICTPRGPVALFRTRDDRIFALEDRCPHRGGPLSQGIVHGARVTCPLHEWVIELATGAAVAPDQGAVATYDVEIRDGAVFVHLPGSSEETDAPPLRACAS